MRGFDQGANEDYDRRRLDCWAIYWFEKVEQVLFIPSDQYTNTYGYEAWEVWEYKHSCRFLERINSCWEDAATISPESDPGSPR